MFPAGTETFLCRIMSDDKRLNFQIKNSGQSKLRIVPLIIKIEFILGNKNSITNQRSHLMSKSILA